jgi:heptosyltransferase III
MKILFVTATRIGDAVLSTGLLAYLIDRYPEARFTIAAGPLAAPLFEAVPRLERLLVVEKRPFSAHWLVLLPRIVGARWHLVVDLRSSALAYLLWTRSRVVGRKGNRRVHRVRELGDLIGVDPPPAPRLWTATRHERAADTWLPDGAPVLALAPAANWRAKTWDAQRFAELARRLTTSDGLLRGARVAVLAAAHECDQVAPVLEVIPPQRRVDLVGKVDLLTAAAILRRTALFVGNDTGLMHIAAAVGTPTLGLFGPSPVERFAPWGDRTAVAQTPLTPDELMGAPDFDYRTTDTLMDGLSVDAVEDAARSLLLRVTGAAA